MQLAIVEGLGITPDSRQRFDCPFCLNKNTFHASLNRGTLLWNCFHSSCNAKGKKEKEKTVEDVQQVLHRGTLEKNFEIPNSFKSAWSTEKTIRYLNENNCIEAVKSGMAEVRYDVRQNRIVFLVKEKDKIVSAVGRGLNSKVYPKWYMYGNRKYPFIVGKGNRLIVVEDCASACAVSSVGVRSMALLGTDFPDEFIKYAKGYDTVFVALDRDATIKAFGIVSRLRYNGIQAEIKLLEKDLKYYKPEQIEDKLCLKQS